MSEYFRYAFGVLVARDEIPVQAGEHHAHEEMEVVGLLEELLNEDFHDLEVLFLCLLILINVLK